MTVAQMINARMKGLHMAYLHERVIGVREQLPARRIYNEGIAAFQRVHDPLLIHRRIMPAGPSQDIGLIS